MRDLQENSFSPPIPPPPPPPPARDISFAVANNIKQSFIQRTSKYEFQIDLNEIVVKLFNAIVFCLS